MVMMVSVWMMFFMRVCSSCLVVLHACLFVLHAGEAVIPNHLPEGGDTEEAASGGAASGECWFGGV